MTEKESKINNNAEITKEEVKTDEKVETKETIKESSTTTESVNKEAIEEPKAEEKKEKVIETKEKVAEAKEEIVTEAKKEEKTEAVESLEAEEKQETIAEVKKEIKKEKRPLEPTEEFDWDVDDTKLRDYSDDEKKKLEDAKFKYLAENILKSGNDEFVALLSIKYNMNIDLTRKIIDEFIQKDSLQNYSYLSDAKTAEEFEQLKSKYENHI